jgi:hypothetical protein
MEIPVLEFGTATENRLPYTHAVPIFAFLKALVGLNMDLQTDESDDDTMFSGQFLKHLRPEARRQTLPGQAKIGKDYSEPVGKKRKLNPKDRTMDQCNTLVAASLRRLAQGAVFFNQFICTNGISTPGIQSCQFVEEWTTCNFIVGEAATFEFADNPEEVLALRMSRIDGPLNVIPFVI